MQRLRSVLSAWLASPFVRQVLSAASGAALAQTITLAFMPLLTRLYGPGPMGLLGIFSAVVGLTSALAALSYPLAVVLPEQAAQARTLVRLSLALGAIASLGAAGVLLTGGPMLLAALQATEIQPWALLIPLAMFAGVCAQVMTQWLARHHAFAFGARYAVLGALLTNGLKAATGWVHPAAGGLIVSNLAGSLLTTALTWWRWPGRDKAMAPDVERPQGHRAERALGQAPAQPPVHWRTLAWRHRDFPLLRMPQDTLNALSQAAPLMLLAAAFGAEAAGHYALAAMVLGAPVTLLGQSAGLVFYPRVTETVRRGGDAAVEILRATRGLALAAALPFAAVVLAGPWLFGGLFGESWWTAGEYARWLAPWFFLQLLNKPAVAAVPALRLQGGLLLYELASTGSKLLALALAWRLGWGDAAAVALFSVAGCVAYVWLIVWILLRARRAGRADGGLLSP